MLMKRKNNYCELLSDNDNNNNNLPGYEYIEEIIREKKEGNKIIKFL